MIPNESSSVSVCSRGSSDPGSDPGRTVVWVRGEHDTATRLHLSDTIAPAARFGNDDVVMDLSGVTFMDASTVGAIVDVHKRLRARSHLLSVRAPSPVARRLLDMCELAFLVDERPSLPPLAPALQSWVAVPVSDRTSDTTPLPGTQQVPSQEPDDATARPRAESAASAQQGRAPG